MNGTETIRVLFVDDEENILRSLKRLVLDEEWSVLTATSGAEGLAVLRKDGPVAVIISDQKMPGLSGTEFLAQTRELSPESQRLILTGYADIHVAVAAINEGGVHRYLTKPWKDQDLLQCLRDSVERYTLRQENRALSDLARRQNEELKEWNAKLKKRVLEQTANIRQKNDALSEVNDR